MLSQIDQRADTASSLPQRVPQEQIKKHKKIIYLRRGESATRSFSRFPRRTIVRLLREGEALVVISRESGRRFIFVCGIPKRIKVVVLPRRTKIVVHCVR